MQEVGLAVAPVYRPEEGIRRGLKEGRQEDKNGGRKGNRKEGKEGRREGRKGGRKRSRMDMLAQQILAMQVGIKHLAILPQRVL